MMGGAIQFISYRLERVQQIICGVTLNRFDQQHDWPLECIGQLSEACGQRMPWGDAGGDQRLLDHTICVLVVANVDQRCASGCNLRRNQVR
ncbi:hypothetical protein EFK68_04960 [Pseudomonas aeruginosa]|nr:hypothetical protein EFK68_04620 [Pseudomonas aeruginosa]RNF58199.1 hypothetical protein EFK68_04960 [Pseudomonas aeruginosa]